MPQPAAAIAPDNIDRIALMAQWGQGQINSIAFSADGEFLALASTLGVSLYYTQTLEEIASIPADLGVASVAFSPDGTELALLVGGYEIQLWGLQNLTHNQTLETVSCVGVEEIFYSSDGNTIVGLGRFISSAVQWWQPDVGSFPENYREFSGGVPLALAPRGNQVLVEPDGFNNLVKVWDVEEGIATFSLEGYSYVTSAAFSPDERFLAVSNFEDISVWHLQNQTLLQTLRLATPASEEGESSRLPIDDPRKMAFSPDGSLLVWATSGGQVWAWEWERGEYYQILEGMGQHVNGLLISPDGETLAISDENEVHLWQMNQGIEQGIIGGFCGNTRQMVFLAAQETLALFSNGSKLRLKGTRDGQDQLTLSFPSTEYETFSADGRLFAASDEGSSVSLWQLPEGNLLYKLEHDQSDFFGGEYVQSLSFTSDGRTLAVGTLAGNVWLWNTSTGERIAKLKMGTDYIIQIAIAPDGSLLATVGSDGIVRIWTLPDGNLLHLLAGGVGGVAEMVFSHNGQFLATISLDHTVWLWQLETGTPTHILECEDLGHIGKLTFSSDDQLIVYLGRTKVWFWQVDEGKLLHTLQGQENQSMTTMIFSPDGMLLAFAINDGTIQIWGVP